MLSLLRIKNIALIDDLEIEFAEGLNLLTGETGSGKSIIVDSLSALTGERLTADLIKEGADSARIEGLFLMKFDENLTKMLEEIGVEIEKNNRIELLIRREISRSKNRVFINDRLVTQSFLKKLGSLLVDIHAQGEQSSLLNVSTHLEMLDEYARLSELRNKISTLFSEFVIVKKQIEDIKSKEAENLRKLDILKFQIEEIKKVNPKEGEEEALEEERRKLSNIEKISTLSQESYALLYENEESILTNLEKIIRKIEELSEYDSRFKFYLQELQNSYALIEDLSVSMRSYVSTLEFSPEKLEEIEVRLAEISQLKRKYGGSIKSVLEFLKNAEKELEIIENAEFYQEKLQKRLETLRSEYLELAGELHRKRLEYAQKFEKEVEENLKKVALEKAIFKVKVLANEGEENFTAKGFDEVEFYFTANIGESPKPLAKIASGGEASRLMLVLKTVAKAAATPLETPKTMVFDEVDVGVSSEVAKAVGAKLKELAEFHQVLCVTHQPQVASFADHHFFIRKYFEENKTKVTVRKLDSFDERKAEIARMLAGEKFSQTAMKHAEEMLMGTKTLADTR
jgi:DNA repair protein RecN (Recombination protein N)